MTECYACGPKVREKASKWKVAKAARRGRIASFRPTGAKMPFNLHWCTKGLHQRKTGFSEG